MILLEGSVIWDATRLSAGDGPRMELTDLVRFKDAWYCGFREGQAHENHPSGRARIIRSADGMRWESVALFGWDGADVREPRFSVTAEGSLMVNTALAFVSQRPRADGRYYQLDDPRGTGGDREPDVSYQSVTWLSRDGRNWSSAYTCPSGINTWRWETHWHNGMGYSVGYAGKDVKGTLYRTRDGRNWRALKEGFFGGCPGNEASFAFGSDDTAYCLVRDAVLRARTDLRGSDGHEIAAGQTRKVHGDGLPALGIGKAPYYQQWEWKSLRADYGPEYGGARPCAALFSAPLGGPKLLRLSDGRLLAVGRMLGPDRDDGRITVFRVDPDAGLLTCLAECDGTTYGGIAEHDGMVWVSFVGKACHRGDWAVRLARVDLNCEREV